MLRVSLLFCCLISDVTLPFENKDFDDQSYSYYYYDEETESTEFPGTEMTRVRRHPEATRTQSTADDLQGLRGALKQIMSGRKIDDWDSDSTNSDNDNGQSTNNSYGYTATQNEYDSLTPITKSDYGSLTPRPDYELVTRTITHASVTPKFKSYHDTVTPITNGYDMLTTRGEYDTLTTTNNEYDNTTLILYDWTDLKNVPHRTTLKKIQNNTKLEVSFGNSVENTTKGFVPSISEYRVRVKPGLRSQTKKTTRTSKKRKTTTRLTTTTTKPVEFDIEKFLEIVANLTYDYYTNLTEQVNATLIRMSVPTCGTPTTTTTTEATTTLGPVDYRFSKENVIGKCYVCGLEDTGIPFNAHCADAFSGDFIPLVPQDPTAKQHITRYKKYCRYQDINNFLLNDTMPRALFGRWTGGCSVRWTDLSGVYTQRTCRNRRQAATGLHFASKRMAKLEMALSNVDNGCIISPVASLLPLSRGVSLFSRFHACVCTGNWCNSSVRFDSDMWMTLTLTAAALTTFALITV